MTLGAILILACCMVFLIYTWLLYPLLLACFARRRGDRPIAGLPSRLPAVHVVLAAYDEERVIGERIANLAACDYPPERLVVWVGTDGCCDGTAAAARQAAADAVGVTVHVREYTRNRGKVAVLKDLVAVASPEDKDLLVLTDANTTFAADAIRIMVRHFSDSSIGCVCGRLILGPEIGESPEAGYWGLETRLKTWESALDSCLGANGAIYAMRPCVFWRQIPDSTIVDDFVLGMKVRELGMRVCFEPAAIGREELPELDDEWGRRVRIGTGDFQALRLCGAMLAPRFGWVAWCFWSHKVLRWFTPHALVLALVAAALLPCAAVIDGWPAGMRSLAALPGLLGACLFTIGLYGRLSKGAVSRLPAAVAHFLTMNAGLLCGYVRWLRGGLQGSWVRTPRRGPLGGAP